VTVRNGQHWSGLRKLLLVAGCWLLVAIGLYGQAVGDFRTVGDVNFAVNTNWQRWNGGAWVAAGAAPASTDGVITILNGHTATLTVSKALDQLVVNSGGILTINTGQTLTVNNSAGTDLDVSGRINNSGTITPNGTIVFNANADYNHTRNGGTIPTATWNASSNCNISGVTTTVPSGINQSFGNFTWNCPGQTGTNLSINPLRIDNGGAVTGNFSIISTGSGSIRYAQTTPRELVVTGDFNISGGTFNLSIGSGAGTFTINGDFNMTGGSINETSTGSGNFTFNNTSSVQNFRRTTGSISNIINFNVNTNVTIDFGVSDYVNGNGTFTLNDGATLQTANTSGINGSIQTSNRSLSTSANYTFDGSSAQVTGSYLPGTVNNLTVNNIQ
jgi:hypothetical protein